MGINTEKHTPLKTGDTCPADAFKTSCPYAQRETPSFSALKRMKRKSKSYVFNMAGGMILSHVYTTGRKALNLSAGV